MEQKKVLIVKGGQWGSATPGDYERGARTLKRLLEMDEDEKPGAEDERVFSSIEIVDGLKEAMSVSSDIVIFLSLGQINDARTLKRERLWVKVVIYTGLIPDEEIIWMNKSWPPEAVREIISHL